MVLRRPLFMQTGRYAAADDRLLFDGLLWQVPGGGARGGVLPLGGSPEQSLLVSADPDAGGVVVAAGAAVVASGGWGGAYLVVNDAPVSVPVPGTGVLVLRVLDVEDGATKQGSRPVFDVIEPPSPDPALPVEGGEQLVSDPPEGESWLPLAKVSAGGGSVVDGRVFTAGLGGVLLVRTVAEMEALGSDAEGADGAVLGSLVFVLERDELHRLTRRGWEQVGAVDSGPEGERPLDAVVSSGSMFYDTGRGLFQAYRQRAGWLTLGERRGRCRRDGSSAWGRYAFAGLGANVASTRKGKLGAAGGEGVISSTGWKPWASFTHVSGASPTAASLQVVAEVAASGGLVRANLSGDVYVRKPDGTGFENRYGYMALQLLKWEGGAWVRVPEYPFVDWGWAAYYYAGFRNRAQDDLTKSRLMQYSLPVGTYLVRPMFMITGPVGDTAEFSLYIHSLSVEVLV